MTALVNSYKSADGVNGNATYSLGFTPTIGNTLVVWAYCVTTGHTITSVALGGSNYFVSLDPGVVDNTYNEATYCFSRVVASGDASSITFVTATGNVFFYVLELQGIVTPEASGYEGATFVRQGGSGTFNAPFTTTNPNDFVLISMRSGSSYGTLNALSSGYTLLPNGKYASELFYTLDSGAAGSKTFSITCTNSGLDPRFHIYRFKAAVTDPTVGTVTGSTVTEGAPVRFTVALSGPTNRATAYSVAFGGTATPGTDYDNNLANATYSTGASYNTGTNKIDFLTGYSGCTVDVPTNDNALSQATRSLLLIVGGVTSTTGSVLDNDPLPSVIVDDASESFGALEFDATLNTASGQPLSFDFATSNGVKVAGTDYQSTSGTLGFNPGDPLTKRVSVRLGAALPPQQLRFASPLNYVTDADSVAAATTYLNVRARVPFLVGSGDLSQIVLAFGAWNLFAGNINFLGNAYTVVSCSIEKDGGTYAPVTFSAGRSKVIADGTAESLSDPISPTAFGLATFARGTKFWIRVEYSVASTGLNLPRGKLSTTQWGTGAASAVLTSGAVASAVDATGAMTFTSGNAAFTQPYSPMVLGKFVSGDPATFIGIGDSIMSGYTDASTGFGQLGGFSFGLTDSDHVSNPLGGANFGYTGSSANFWASANNNILVNYLKYAKYAVDGYETNRVNSNGALAVAKSETQALWAQCAANGIKRILRLKLLPRSTGSDGTLPYSTSWSVAGGDAVAFNDWLNTPNLGLASGVTISPILLPAVRASLDPTNDNYYRWLGATSGNLGPNTTDGTHPNAAGYALIAGNFRGVFGMLT